MAPRGRRKKVGMKRIDAAIDALTPLGFPKEVVRKTVNDLLKVYDDDAGWVFIEEASYKLVIETILEQQEQEARKEEGNPDEAGALEVAEEAVEVAETSSLREALPYLPNSQEEGNQDAPGALEVGDQVVEAGETSSPWEALPHLPNSGLSVAPLRRRMPCFGWISESEDEDEDPPSVTPKEEPESNGCLRRQRKRRWDVKPNGMLN